MSVGNCQIACWTMWCAPLFRYYVHLFFRYPIVHVDSHAILHVQLGPSFPCPSQKEKSWTSRRQSKGPASPIDAHSSLAELRVYRGDFPGTFPPAWRKFPSVRIARQFSRVATSVHRSLSQPTLLRNSGTLHSKEQTAKTNTTRVVEKMVYSATESVKKRLGSCEKVTMKLRSLLNISSISSTCASHKRLEGSLEVKDREFRSVTVTRGET